METGFLEPLLARESSVNKADLEALVTERVADADVLLKNNRYSAAYYLCGYAIECAIKVCIAGQTQRHDFPPKPNIVRDIYTHELQRLLKAANLEAAWKLAVQSDKELEINWLVIQRWTEEDRYRLPSQQEAQDLYQAVTEPTHGMLQWIQKYW